MSDLCLFWTTKSQPINSDAVNLMFDKWQPINSDAVKLPMHVILEFFTVMHRTNIYLCQQNILLSCWAKPPSIRTSVWQAVIYTKGIRFSQSVFTVKLSSLSRNMSTPSSTPQLEPLSLDQIQISLLFLQNLLDSLLVSHDFSTNFF